MTDDILLRKAESIERAIARVREEYCGYEDKFETNYTKQDAIILNIQRACEAAIDMAARVIRINKLGIPQSNRDLFELLLKAGKLSPELANSMQAMVGFRNIAVHDYQSLRLPVIKAIIEKHLEDFLQFSKMLLEGC